LATLVLLWPSSALVRFGESEARGLARIGVTRLRLLRDEDTVGVVMDGWAFDPDRHAEEAIAALSADAPIGRLLPVAEIGVTGPRHEGGAS
jgi:hypothetical protein